MTCKDCIHYEACELCAKSLEDATKIVLNQNVKLKFPYENIECAAFKPKSRFIELPCAVGDTVWFLNDRYHISLMKNTVYQAVVSRINILKDNKICITIQIKNENGCHEIQDISDIGKTLFLTHEEAERAFQQICIQKCQKDEEVKEFQIWSKGYRATGQSADDMFHGIAKGRSFKEACINFAKVNKSFKKHFDEYNMTFWGCSLFPKSNYKDSPYL